MLSEQELETELCPWQTVIEQFLSEFMQFFYPAAWAEIDWELAISQVPLPVNCTPLATAFHGNEDAPDQVFSRHCGASAFAPVPLEILVQVHLRSGQRCRLYLYLGWQSENRARLAQHIYRTQCALYSDCAEPVASFAVLGGKPQPVAAPASFAWECLGNQLGMFFPCVYFCDFAGQEASLKEDDNAFALLTLAQLRREQTAGDMAARHAAKWTLIQSMFERGWARERIIVLFLALDWSLPLPLRWSARLWREIEQFEEQQIMRYVSSVERFIRERERQQGYQQGEVTMLQHLLVHRFGELPLWVGMQIQGGNGEQRVAWLQRALAARNLEEVFHEDA